MGGTKSEKRDQGLTPFSRILEELCQLTGAHAAALVDQEGETVDYAGSESPFDIRVLAAEWRLILQLAEQGKHLSSLEEFTVRAKKKSFHLRRLPEGYALVLELPYRAAGISERPVCHCVKALCREAGFERVSPEADWSSVVVGEDRKSYRPATIELEGQAQALEVLGRLDPRMLRTREQGFRVRLPSGLEGTLVREPMGHWFLEEEVWES